MKSLSPLLSGVLLGVSLTTSSLHADQLNEFSVFQPVNGISANIYIEKSKVIIQPSNAKPMILNRIKPEYQIKKYADKLYLLKDIDHNGSIDIATLYRIDQGATRFCYNVYSYQSETRRYSRQPTYTECNSRAGTVIYAIRANNIAHK